jgi:hypothetical protein
MGKRIVFSDATWYINPEKVSELQKLLKGCDQGTTFTCNQNQEHANIGLMVIDCDEYALSIWEEAKKSIQVDRTLHDQNVINSLVKDLKLFDNSKIVARWPESLKVWNSDFRNSFLALKIFTPSSEDKFTRDIFRYESMKTYGYHLNKTFNVQ